MNSASIAHLCARAGGATLAAVTSAVAVLRRPAKPLHPRGEVFSGRLHRRGTIDVPPTGVGWLDEPGEDEVLVRLSRAVGLPGHLPDIHGLAVRVIAPDGPADILFATTGTGRIGRYLLTACRHPGGRPMTTLLPYRTAAGAVILSAEIIHDRTCRLSWALGSGPWHPFGTIDLSRDHGDPGIWFDPVMNQMAGLGQFPFVLLLREPAYRRARRTRTTPDAPRGETAGTFAGPTG